MALEETRTTTPETETRPGGVCTYGVEAPQRIVARLPAIQKLTSHVPSVMETHTDLSLSMALYLRGFLKDGGGRDVTCCVLFGDIEECSCFKISYYLVALLTHQ